MRLLFIVLYLVLINQPGFSQKERIYFSEAISTHLPKYQKNANKAYRLNNVERADFLFDSLIDHGLKGSYLDNFKVHSLRKKEVYLEDFKKPVFLRTYTSWLVLTKGEIPALNQLAGEYKENVDFVVLFWDTRKTVKELAKKFDENITILYVDELENKSPGVISTMKHSLGFPITFLLDRNNKILDIRRSISHPYGIELEESFELNYDSIAKGISLLMLAGIDQIDTTERVAEAD